MRYIGSFSGGASSAVAIDRAIAKYGKRKFLVWFANTLVEDDDLYRFKDDCKKRWSGVSWLEFTDGRTPEKIAEDRQIIPNQKIAPCTYELKIKPFTEMLWKTQKNVTVFLGLDWHEMDRIEKRCHYHWYNGKPRKPKGYHTFIPGVYEDYPLLWKPYCWNVFDEIKAWGIKPPRLYEMGFSHNNCGGACFRQSIDDWVRLRYAFPERFQQKAEWEQIMREKLNVDYAICRDQSKGSVKPLTLLELAQRKDKKQASFAQEDLFACVCSY